MRRQLTVKQDKPTRCCYFGESELNSKGAYEMMVQRLPNITLLAHELVSQLLLGLF